MIGSLATLAGIAVGCNKHAYYGHMPSETSFSAPMQDDSASVGGIPGSTYTHATPEEVTKQLDDLVMDPKVLKPNYYSFFIPEKREKGFLFYLGNDRDSSMIYHSEAQVTGKLERLSGDSRDSKWTVGAKHFHPLTAMQNYFTQQFIDNKVELGLDKFSIEPGVIERASMPNYFGVLLHLEVKRENERKGYRTLPSEIVVPTGRFLFDTDDEVMRRFKTDRDGLTADFSRTYDEVYKHATNTKKFDVSFGVWKNKGVTMKFERNNRTLEPFLITDKTELHE